MTPCSSSCPASRAGGPGLDPAPEDARPGPVYPYLFRSVMRCMMTSRRVQWAILPFVLGGLLALQALATSPAQAQQKGKILVEPEAFAGAEEAAVIRHSLVQDGIAVTLTMEPAYPTRRLPGPLRQGDDVIFRFKIADTANETPATRVYPAAWMDLIPDGEARDDDTCRKKTKTFLGGSFYSAAELDLNVYYVLALNDDATITVVDPLFGFGGTKLLAMVPLQSPGEDWALTADQGLLFVSLPDSEAVAVVETATWQVYANVAVGPRPVRVALQPDEHYLWVGNDADAPEGAGVTVLATKTLAVAAHIPTGRGHHELAFTHDNRYAFVTNADAGTVSVIDVRTLRKIKDLHTGPRPTSLAYSPIGGTVYVADAEDGSIVVFDAYRHEIITRIQAEPGLGALRFAPGGRLGFVVNPQEDLLHILDAATNRLVQTGDMLDEPVQLGFSDELAYVLHRGNETVYMIPLDEVGVKDAPVPVVDFPGGQHPPGRATRPVTADLLVQAPGANAVLVANAADQSVYFYKEGMAGPMGQFTNYGREPRAVQVVDRSLRQRTAPGVYETVARLRRPGPYDVVFFMDAPRIIHCFGIQVAPDPTLEAANGEHAVAITPLTQQRLVPAGASAQLRFQLTDRGTRAPLTDVQDVQILVSLAPGIWHRRQQARHDGNGIYTADFVLPQPGVYYAYLSSGALKVPFRNPHYSILRATAPQEPGQ